ncbi:hypothetical protein OHA18_21510 [Kribbella sp. NBC_00709]|uniref:hypothetical protein n=1 Tax=Kribbella sp. NBC_00709 TaxID=2975972 RepID=UPI002E2962CF|nr:hypothetical protein [Kribbella sp. NBC_00709]
MKRSRTLGVAVVVTGLLLGVTACGSEDGTSAGAAETPAAKHSALSGPAQKSKSSLAGLVALPRGYVADPRNDTGPFTATAFLNTWSADPALDRALLLNASFAEGYRASRVSPDRKKRYTLQLFKTGSAGKAAVLQKGLWNQDTHEHPFNLAGALSDARVEYDGGTDQSAAVAEVSLAVGPMVVEISVREVGALGSNLTPDTALVTALAKEQRARLTATSS